MSTVRSLRAVQLLHTTTKRYASTGIIDNRVNSNYLSNVLSKIYKTHSTSSKLLQRNNYANITRRISTTQQRYSPIDNNTQQTTSPIHNIQTIHNIEKHAQKQPINTSNQHSNTSSTSAQQTDTTHATDVTTSQLTKSQQLRETARDKAHVAKGRLKQLWHQYGYVAIGTYLVFYVSTLFGIYLLYHYHIISFDPMTIVRYLHLESHVSKYDPRSGEFALAWITTKLTEPIRLALTAAATPRIARLLGRAPPKLVKQAVQQATKQQTTHKQ